MLHAFEVIAWPIEQISKRFDKRFELATSIMMTVAGIILLFSPRSMEETSFRYMLNTVPFWACFLIFFVMGITRIIALKLNGHWMPQGAYVRAVGAALGALMWSQMGAALFYFQWEAAAPMSPGVGVYITLAVFEVEAMFRALKGARENGYRG